MAAVRAFVLHPVVGRTSASLRTPAERLEEAVGLARAIALDVAAAEVVRVAQARPGTLFGKGAIEGFKQRIADEKVALLVVDTRLTPTQQRNLERALDCKVIDRTALILEIFGARARTHEGRLQVELAALTYQRSRLVRSWTHLERQRGGGGFLGGPGERQLELDRRLIDEQIVRLKARLVEVTRTRGLHRQARKRVPYPLVALVGYTNAGKSTLFNRLTAATVVAADMLFATLDPTMRRVALPSGRQVIVSDTVGFISDLPTQLIAAFRATLEEVNVADLILHVRDVAHPESEAQRRDVSAILEKLGKGQPITAGIIEVYNKIDLLVPEARLELEKSGARNQRGIAVSALTGEGGEGLLAAIDDALNAGRHIVELAVPITDGAAIAWLYQHGEVLARRDDDTHAHIRARLEPADALRFAHSASARLSTGV